MWRVWVTPLGIGGALCDLTLELVARCPIFEPPFEWGEEPDKPLGRRARTLFNVPEKRAGIFFLKGR